MNLKLTREELESRLENQVVYLVLNELSIRAKRWDGGGALIHRVMAMGYMAETGARNIKEGMTPISKESTFQDMYEANRQMYDDMIGFLYPLVRSGIYHP